MPNANQDMMVPSSAADSTLRPELSEDVWVSQSMAKEKPSRPPREWLCVSLTQIRPVKMISTALTSMTLWRATTANTGSPMRSLAREQSNALNLPPKTLSNSETLSSAEEALAGSDLTASTLTTRLHQNWTPQLWLVDLPQSRTLITTSSAAVSLNTMRMLPSRIDRISWNPRWRPILSPLYIQTLLLSVLIL